MSWKRVKQQQQKKKQKEKSYSPRGTKAMPENEYNFNISNRLLKSVRILVEPVQRKTCLKHCSKVLRSLLSRLSALTIDF